MNANPYSPPVASESDVLQRSWVCVVMFWLSAILGIVVIAITILGGYHNTRFILENGGRFPPYVVAVTLLVFTCGLGLLFSAWHWRSRRIRIGLLSFIGSGVGFFVGPWLLLLLLGR